MTPDCPLCKPSRETVVWHDGSCRVILVEDPDYAGFCRVIWHAHIAEMTDLTPAEQRHLMNVVFATEAALRSVMRPHKINLASFGNVVPHLHWHVIPRYTDDRHFPQPVWGSPQREAARRPQPDARQLASAVVAMLTEQTSG